MAGDAYDTIETFWRIQDDGDYTAVVSLFAEDAVLEDPILGTFEGRAAIAGFMEKMNVETRKAGVSFRLVELAGDDETAWARWVADSPQGEREGVGIYRVRDGRLTYYRDYMNPAPKRE